MANKKKTQPQQNMSPERFVKERARSLEIGPCYMSQNIKDWGEGGIIVTRLHKGGKYTFAFFHVDMNCLGVRDAECYVRKSEDEYEAFVANFKHNWNAEKITYEEAHNRIYGAIAFAEEAGIEPCEEFGLAQYVLEEDTDDIPLIEYDYGRDGKHFLVADSQLEADFYLPTLRWNLGEGNFDYVIEDSYDDEEDDYDDDEDVRLKYKKWEHPYTYKPTRIFPKVLYVENSRLMEIIRKEEADCLTDEEIDELLALPQDSLRKDAENFILFALGQWWKNQDLDRYEFSDALFHAMMILGVVGDDGSLDAVTEVMRIPSELDREVFGDVGDNAYIPVLVRTGQNQLSVLFDFMKEVGLDNTIKFYVTEAVRHIGLEFGRRDEAIDWYRKLMRDIIADFPNAKYTDATVNAFIVYDVITINAQELIPEIKELHDLDFVDLSLLGNYSEAVALFGKEENTPVDFDLKRRYKNCIGNY